MQEQFFYLFFVLALVSAVLVVVNRNPVNSAMFMILTLLSIAGMFALLEAYFLAILQVLVNAGAVMVLFLFIIMLIDVQSSSKRSSIAIMAGGAIIAGLAMLGAVWMLLGDGESLALVSESLPAEEMPVDGNPFTYSTSPTAFGWGLFSKYMLPIQVTGFLLLVAMIGVIVISRKPKTEEEEDVSAG